MIQNKIQNIETSSISVSRESRQRSDLTPESVKDLAYSIGQSQWINPILVDSETHTLIAGERRFTAVQLLQSALAKELPEELQSHLDPVCQCKVDSWANWTKIPAQLGTNLTPLDLLVYEFIENKEREDISWQDKAKAVYTIHSEATRKSDKKWSAADTARLVGYSTTIVSRSLLVSRALLEEDPKIAEVVKESTSMVSAVQAIERVKSRREDKPKITLGRPAPATKPEAEAQVETPQPTEDSDLEPLSLGESAIQCADFHSWAASYTGEPFNFIHCDFPYGIGYNTGGNFNTAPDRIQVGQYDDSEEVYWDLINTLYKHQEKLIAHSAHVMFWFSQNLRHKTEDVFRELFPRAHLHSHLMIWQHDARQTTPDPQRYGQRNYETAMCLTFGDRKIVKPVRLAKTFELPSGRVHRSEKPADLLAHFFSMFVDDTTRFFDPTCGSASSLIAAHKLQAQSICGLELDPQMATEAIRHFDAETQK